jgi:hypothetical protein
MSAKAVRIDATYCVKPELMRQDHKTLIQFRWRYLMAVTLRSIAGCHSGNCCGVYGFMGQLCY